ncbi:hypothetical protein [Propioniciclava flava]
MRAAYVLPLLWRLQYRVRRDQQRAAKLDRIRDKVEVAKESGEPFILTRRDCADPPRRRPRRSAAPAQVDGQVNVQADGNTPGNGADDW